MKIKKNTSDFEIPLNPPLTGKSSIPIQLYSSKGGRGRCKTKTKLLKFAAPQVPLWAVTLI